jgi:hypothetical protein
MWVKTKYPMNYRDIVEADAQAQANTQETQREKSATANGKTAKASQTYRDTVKAAHTSATAAKRKLSASEKPPAPSKPATCSLAATHLIRGNLPR